MGRPLSKTLARAEEGAFARLVAEVVRLNGLLRSIADDLTQVTGLTSARWQVLGAARLAGCSLTVAQIAKNMGLTRQSVQRIANDLVRDGFATFRNNPDHSRAKFLVATRKGIAAFDATMRVHDEWSRTVENMPSVVETDLAQAAQTLRNLRIALERREPGSVRRPRDETAGTAQRGKTRF